MNKTAIKNFAIWARRKLISDITYKAGIIGISKNSILQPLSISTNNVQFFDIGTGKPTEISNDEIKQRDALVKRIKEKESTSDYKTAFQFVMEEVAYTWFNRLIAIRFMEVNEYLPSRIRVLSSETKGKSEPDMVTTPFETDMEFSPYEKDRIMQLKDENKLDELFRMLFIKQCNKLNEVLPELFEKTSDYTEFLLNISFTDKDGIVSHLVNDIEEEDFTEAVEIIGWLYQYYNTEPKEEVFALLKKNVKITKERIPAATQLFTPDWIVRYMVENSLGRLWIERERAISGVSDEYLNGSYFGWEYYLEEAEQEESVNNELEKIRAKYKNLSLEDIKIIDICMGSGHILVYAFDVLMQIYESQGYTQQDAAQAIIENNLYGLDIDERAYQLAYFAVMMKARKYDRRFLTRGVSPKLYSIQESNNIKKSHLQYFGKSLNEMERNIAVQQMEYLLDVYYDAKEYGSILNVDVCDWDLLNRFADDYSNKGQISIDNMNDEQSQSKLKELIAIAETMAQKYDVVVTNPPYMGGNGMNSKVSDYVKKNYPDSNSDLFAVFIEKCMQMTKTSFYTAMITQHAFMFLSSYEKLRSKLLFNDFVNMAHLGARAFEEIGGEVVQTTSFVLRKSNIENYKAIYARLVDYNNQQGKENAFLAKNDLHIAQKENFSKIPGLPIVYWLSESMLLAFSAGEVLKIKGDTRQGMATSDNNRFLRLWFEVKRDKIGLNCSSSEESVSIRKKWYPYNKGGEFRKWYGNIDYTINYENDGYEVKKYATSLYKTPTRTIKSISEYFKPCLSWSKISSGSIAFRYYPKGFVFDVAGCCIFYSDESIMFYDFGLINSKVVKSILDAISPTLNYEAGHISSLPVIRKKDKSALVGELTQSNIRISKSDWDSFETSWDFITHPFITYRSGAGYKNVPMDKWQFKISDAFRSWENNAKGQFNILKANEEELNRIFIEIYGLQDELTPEVEDKDVTVRKADLQRDIKSFISFAVGCMFGRYSLDVEGLAYAGGEWDDNKYTTFIPDNDNVIPITDEEYFKDDIVGLFVAFVKKVYGIETLEENLDFIAKALGNKGDTSREVIRNYFVKDFIKDHIKTYQKRPIYWLYDSGKQDGFKALIYMHRYNIDTTGIVRVDYLHKMQRIYMSEIERMQDMAENSTQAREIAQAEKRKEKLIKQLKETKEYDEKISHIALSRIEIDLDDGVKVNYEKVQTGKDGKKLSILHKI